MKKRIQYLLLACICVVSSLYIPETTVHAANAENTIISNEDITEGEDKTNDCTVTVSIGSSFTVTLPKKITLAGSDGVGGYDVTVKGNIAARQRVSVVPDETFNLTSAGKADVITAVEQQKKVFTYSDAAKLDGNSLLIGTTAPGSVSAGPLTKGTWSGTFNFHIDSYTYSQIGVEATDQNDVDLNAEAFTIEGQEKKELIDALVNSDLVPNITSPEDIDALIEVKSDDFDDIADTVFTVDSIANDGDTVVILHYNEETGEWEYIGTETVVDGKVGGDFISYSPVAFIVVKEDGTLHVHNYTVEEKQATCTEDGVKVYLCECGDTKTENVTATGHVDDDANNICDVCGEEIEYTSFTLTASNYSQAGIERSGDVVIPETFKYDGVFYEVTGIGHSAFENCTDLTSVIIPDSVTSLGISVFEGCSSLKQVDIGNGITNINSSTFSWCEKLTSVILSNKLTIIGWRAFYQCENLTNITIPDGVTAIGDSAFYGCSKIKIITIPDSVTTIGKEAFYCVKHITYNGTATGSPWGASYTNGFFEGDFIYADDTKTTLYLYIGNDDSVAIPDGVKSICSYAFSANKELTDVVIPSSVTSIESNAFYNCTGLNNLTVPDNVTAIGSKAFYKVPHVTYTGTATGSPWGAKSIN